MNREEAIRRIRAWNLESDDLEVLRAVIPEFKDNEEEVVRKEIVNYIKNGGKTYFPKQETKEKWIVWLEKQWSKEDYNMLNRLIGVLEQTNKEDYHEAWEETFLPWLKSLKFQSHYKPKEYQLKALNEIVNFCGNSSNVHFNDYLYNVLKHLLDDLKNCKTS